MELLIIILSILVICHAYEKIESASGSWTLFWLSFATFVLGAILALGSSFPGPIYGIHLIIQAAFCYKASSKKMSEECMSDAERQQRLAFKAGLEKVREKDEKAKGSPKSIASINLKAERAR